MASTYKDVIAILDEITKGAYDRSRTSDSIKDKKIQTAIIEKSIKARKALAATSAVAATAVAGAAISTMSTAATAGTVAGVYTVAVTGGSAAAGAATGAAAGSAVPLIGTLIGAAVGAGVGVFVGKRMKKKDEKLKDEIRNRTIQNQSRIIKDIEREVQELKEKLGAAVDNNKRYQYLLGLLMANEEIKAWVKETYGEAFA